MRSVLKHIKYPRGRGILSYKLIPSSPYFLMNHEAKSDTLIRRLVMLEVMKLLNFTETATLYHIRLQPTLDRWLEEVIDSQRGKEK